jgi:hypothetical protein
MEVARFSTVAVLPALVWATMPAGMVSERTTPLVAAAECSDLTATNFGNVESFTENTSVTIKESAKEWTTQMDKRFENLAILEATGKISAEETSELELLTHDRRNLKYPRSSDEVLWEYHQRQATENLVKAVRDYARFHSVADTKRSRS